VAAELELDAAAVMTSGDEAAEPDEVVPVEEAIEPAESED
jgi:hypothetical protein